MRRPRRRVLKLRREENLSTSRSEKNSHAVLFFSGWSINSPTINFQPSPRHSGKATCVVGGRGGGLGDFEKRQCRVIKDSRQVERRVDAVCHTHHVGDGARHERYGVADDEGSFHVNHRAGRPVLFDSTRLAGSSPSGNP